MRRPSLHLVVWVLVVAALAVAAGCQREEESGRVPLPDLGPLPGEEPDPAPEPSEALAEAPAPSTGPKAPLANAAEQRPDGAPTPTPAAPTPEPPAEPPAGAEQEPETVAAADDDSRPNGEAEDEPEPSEDEPEPELRGGTASADGLRIIEAAVAPAVENRRPVGASDSFASDVGQLFGWLSIENPGEPKNVTMLWKREGREAFRIELQAGTSSGWRTWSRKRIQARDAGSWTVEVLSPSGAVLHTMNFEVESP